MDNLTGKNTSYSMDETDRQILIYLQQDANPNIKELADKLNLTKTPVYKRIKQLEDEGYIDKYVFGVGRNCYQLTS